MPDVEAAGLEDPPVRRVSPLESGRRAALIVATGHYDDPALQRLRAPAADAEQFAMVLGRPDIAGFEVQKIVDQPTRVISKELQKFLSSGTRSDLLLLYFSCHGLKDIDGSLYLRGPHGARSCRVNRSPAVAGRASSTPTARSSSRRLRVSSPSSSASLSLDPTISTETISGPSFIAPLTAPIAAPSRP